MMTNKVLIRSPYLPINGRTLFPIRSDVHVVDEPPADAAATLSAINEKQTDDDYKLEGIILYICSNHPKCKRLWAVTWVEEPKCPTQLIKVAKYKELAVKTVCAECELAEWEIVDKAEAEGKDEAEDWVGA